MSEETEVATAPADAGVWGGPTGAQPDQGPSGTVTNNFVDPEPTNAASNEDEDVDNAGESSSHGTGMGTDAEPRSTSDTSSPV